MDKPAKFVSFEPEKAAKRQPHKRKPPNPDMAALVGRFAVKKKHRPNPSSQAGNDTNSPFDAPQASQHSFQVPQTFQNSFRVSDQPIASTTLPLSPPQHELQLPEQLRPPTHILQEPAPVPRRIPPLSDTPVVLDDTKDDPLHPLNYPDKVDTVQVHKTLSEMKAYYESQLLDKGGTPLSYTIDDARANSESNTQVQLHHPQVLPKLRVHSGFAGLSPVTNGIPGMPAGVKLPKFTFSRLPDPYANSLVQQIATTPNERKLLENYLQFLSPYFDYLPQPQLTALMFETFEPELTKKIVMTMSYLHLISAASQHTLVKKHVLYIKLCFFKLLRQEGFMELASMGEEDAYRLRRLDSNSKDLPFKNTEQSRKNIKAILILLISMVVIETINGGRSSSIRNHMYMYAKIVSQPDIRDFLIQQNSGKFLINSYVWFDLITSASSHDSRAPFIVNPEMFDGPSIGLNYMVNCSIKTMQTLYEVTVLRSDFKAFQEDLAQSAAYTPERSAQLRALWERGQTLKRELLIELHSECAAGYPEHSEEHIGCKCWCMAVLVFLLRIFKSCKPEVWADIRALCIQFMDLNLRLDPQNKVANMLVWPLFLVGCELKTSADFTVKADDGTVINYQDVLRARVSRLRHSLGVGNWRTLQIIVESCWKHEVDWEVHLSTGIWKQHDFMPI
ncbi:hypothetical protein CKK34_3555 [Yarrowia sp. E02]|nr:hypothetical protein CKK34_3555 [Yarrowia sp. E02]